MAKPSRKATRDFKTRVCCYCALCDQDKLARGEKPCNKKEIQHGACRNYREMKKGGKKRGRKE
ncbi:hypothetical protein ES708_29631 [subsurface metagenome]